MDNAAESLINRKIVVEETAILIQHLYGLTERRPCSAVRAVGVDRNIDICSSLVQRSVNYEASLVDLVFRRRQGVALFIDEDQIAGIDKTEVNRMRICELFSCKVL